jgi:hypothetical protein
MKPEGDGMQNSLYDHELDALPPLAGPQLPPTNQKTSGQDKTLPPQAPGNHAARLLWRWFPASSGHEVLAGLILAGIVVQRAVRPTWTDAVVLVGLPFVTAFLWRLRTPAVLIRAYRASTAVTVLGFELAVLGIALHLKPLANDLYFILPAQVTALLFLPLVKSLGWRDGWGEGVRFPLFLCIWNVVLATCVGIVHDTHWGNQTVPDQSICGPLTIVMILLAALALIPYVAFNSFLDFRDKRQPSLKPGRLDVRLATKG